MFKSEYHIWDFPPEMSVDLEDEFRKEMFYHVIKRYGSQRNLAVYLTERGRGRGITEGVGEESISRYKNGGSSIPLWIFPEFLPFLDTIYEDEIENHVVCYGYPLSHERINPEVDGERKLPIEHDVYFDYFAGIMDTATIHDNIPLIKRRPGKGVGEIGRKVFGRFEHRPSGEYLSFPKTLKIILEFIHGFPSLDEPIQNRVAFIAGIIRHRGSIGHSCICVYRDRESLKRMNRLLRSINCWGTLSRYRSMLWINKDSSLRLLDFIEQLPKDLQLRPYQNEVIKERIRRGRSEPQYLETRMGQIIEILNSDEMTIDELAVSMDLSYTRTYRLVKMFVEDGFIQEVDPSRRVNQLFSVC